MSSYEANGAIVLVLSVSKGPGVKGLLSSLMSLGDRRTFRKYNQVRGLYAFGNRIGNGIMGPFFFCCFAS